MSTSVEYYSYSTITSNFGRLEATKKMSKRELAQMVYDRLNEAGMLEDGTTVEDIEERVYDLDGDGLPDIDVAGLINDGKIKARYDNTKIIEALQRGGRIVQYLPDQRPKGRNLSDYEASPLGKSRLNEHKLLLGGTDLLTLSVDASTQPAGRTYVTTYATGNTTNVISSTAPPVILLDDDHSVSDAIDYFQGLFTENGGSVETFNRYLNAYFSKYYFHIG
jgi:hypothetical protein